jgi:glycosyltransferase involved in cell wall biosynthesis
LQQVQKRHKWVVLFPFPGDSLGGSTVSATLFLKEVQKYPKWQVVVVVHTAHPLARWFEAQGIPVEVLTNAPVYDSTKSPLARLADLLRARRSIQKVLKRHRASLVHSNDIRTHITWGFGLLGTQVEHIWHQRTKWSKSILATLLVRRASQRICISRFVEAGLREGTGLDSVLVPNPLKKKEPISSTVPHKERIFSWKKEQAEASFVIGYVGAYKAQKRPKDFIDIVQKTKVRVGSHVRWFMIGKDGDYTLADMMSYARKLEVLDVLAIHPFQENISDWYSAMDCLIATSENEGLGRNIIEAMATNTIVVASDSGGHVELIENQRTGYLVPLGDIRAYADAMQTIISKGVLNDPIRNAAREFVIEQYELDRSVEKMLAVYSNLLE